MYDNTHERQTTKPSVPLITFDADNRPMWKVFGRNEYVYEPELEAIYMAAQQRPTGKVIQLSFWEMAA